jgi:Protein of unknown function (DUF2442)
MIEVESAKYIDDYKFLVTFNTGEVREVDISTMIWGEVFEPLKDKEKVKKFEIKWGTLAWENGADIAPEWLYDNSIEVKTNISTITGTND